MATITQLTKELERLEKKFLDLESKFNKLVELQFYYENNFVNYENNNSYIKSIEKQFEVSFLLEEQKKLITNKKAQIKRKTK
jgi:hypothetical protein